MASIGIGCTTFNRPECLAKWKEQIAKHTFMDNVLIYVAEDTDEDRQGVAKRKNECLRALKGCDFVFLLDDDTYPIKDGWVEFFINSDEPHLLFLNKTHKKNMVEMNCYAGNELHHTVESYADCGGVFMFMKKEVLERVGAFNEKFERYGFEHAEYSIRILGSHGAYPMLKGTDEYLYSEDYSNPNHKSSITDEEKKMHVRNNWDKFFKEPINQIYIPL